MKSNYTLLLIFLFFLSNSICAQDRYVSVSGAGNHDGTNENNAWNLVEADQANTTNMTVHVKAGDYGSVNLLSFESGSTWRGYKNFIGDISSSNGSIYNYPDALNENNMPTITGSNISSGVAINIISDSVTIENFQITNVNIGLIMSGDNGNLKNIVCHTLGTQSGAEIYEGIGIRVTGNNIDVDNCTLVNCAAEGVSLQGNEAKVNYCNVYSDKVETDNGTDYYILVSGGNNNVIKNSSVNRFNETNAGRHGFVIKTSGTGNLIEDCVANDINIEAQYVAVQNNVFKNITINGTYSIDKDQAARIRIANGANHNKFINIRLNDVHSAVNFADWDDMPNTGDGNLPEEAGGGNNNLIINPIVNKARMAIHFEKADGVTTMASDNYIIGATFYDVQFLFGDYLSNAGNKIINSVIDKCQVFKSYVGQAGVDSSTVFQNVNITNSPFVGTLESNYITSNITEHTVPFTNAIAGRFSLTSDILNIGEDTSLIVSEASYDFIGNTRNVPYTIGAIEFENSTTTCPENIPNENTSLQLTDRSAHQSTISTSTSTVTNASDCAVKISSPAEQRWARQIIPIEFSDHGINVGDQISITVDGRNGSGNAYIQIVKNNIFNDVIAQSNFSPNSNNQLWVTKNFLITVTSDMTSLGIFLFSNHGEVDTAGHAYYDNLNVEKIVGTSLKTSLYIENGLSRVQLESVNVVPNPSANQIKVTLPLETNYTKYNLFSLNGVLVKKGVIEQGQTTLPITIYDIENGMYLLNLFNDNGENTFIKILKE